MRIKPLKFYIKYDIFIKRKNYRSNYYGTTANTCNYYCDGGRQ